MKKWSLAVLAGLLITPAFACDMCAVYTASEAQGGAGDGWTAGFAEQFTHFGTLQNDSKKVSSEGSYIDSSVTQLFVGYSVSKSFSVQLNLPVIYRSFGRGQTATYNPAHGSETGIGDMSIVGNYRLWQKFEDDYSVTWSVLGGVKLPSGDSNRLGDPDYADGIGGHDLALGSGSVDGVIGTGVFARWKRFIFTGNMQYALRTVGSFGHKYADEFSWSVAPGAYLMLHQRSTLSLQFVASGESKGKDTFNDIPDDDSGESIVYVGPQLNWTHGSRFSAQAGLDVPVRIRNTGLAAVPDYRVHAAVTWRF